MGLCLGKSKRNKSEAPVDSLISNSGNTTINALTQDDTKNHTHSPLPHVSNHVKIDESHATKDASPILSAKGKDDSGSGNTNATTIKDSTYSSPSTTQNNNFSKNDSKQLIPPTESPSSPPSTNLSPSNTNVTRPPSSNVCSEKTYETPHKDLTASENHTSRERASSNVSSVTSETNTTGNHAPKFQRKFAPPPTTPPSTLTHENGIQGTTDNTFRSAIPTTDIHVHTTTTSNNSHDGNNNNATMTNNQYKHQSADSKSLPGMINNKENATIPFSKSGILGKQGKRFKTFSDRYFILKEGILSNYTNETSSKNYEIKLDRDNKKIHLRGYNLLCNVDKLQFTLESTDHSKLLLHAKSKEVYNSWNKAFKDHVAYANGYYHLVDDNMSTKTT